MNVNTTVIPIDLFEPAEGWYGDYGGMFIPEMLYPNVEELKENYRSIMDSADFSEKFSQLIQHYSGRPTPLYFAERLSEKLGFGVWLKREDLNHTGSHKLNNVIGQILIALQLNKKHIIAETGAGQHGVATATLCAKMGIPCTIFMGETDIKRQQPNVLRMKMLGAEVRSVSSGSKTLKDATNEALRHWIQYPRETYYLIGSAIGPHPYPDMVARFQSVISEELKRQIHEQQIQNVKAIIACVGGGSNAIGAFYHFINNEGIRLIGVEAAGKGLNTSFTAATLTLGEPGILHGCKSYILQDENGQIQEAHSISAGLDYPGVGPIHAFLKDSGRAEYVSVTDEEAISAALDLMRLEGIVPALESAHALAYLPKLDLSSSDHVVVNLSGRGEKDMDTYIQFSQI
ncbi:MAG: tryptophan synthase subunit beta [Calditrichia bacterium]